MENEILGYKKGISIFITAYHTIDYIDSTLESVYNQDWFEDHDNWEVIVICDGDDEIFEHLKTSSYRNFRLFKTKENVGTYVASNTAARLCQYDWIMRFDSDDLMEPNCVSTVMSNVKYNLDAIYYRGPRWGRTPIAVGQVCIKHDLFNTLGGFQPWPCSADTNLKLRLIPYCRIKFLHDNLITFRERPDSLTSNDITGLHTDTREKYREINRNTFITKPEDAIIDYTVTEYDEFIFAK